MLCEPSRWLSSCSDTRTSTGTREHTSRPLPRSSGGKAGWASTCSQWIPDRPTSLQGTPEQHFLRHVPRVGALRFTPFLRHGRNRVVDSSASGAPLAGSIVMVPSALPGRIDSVRHHDVEPRGDSDAAHSRHVVSFEEYVTVRAARAARSRRSRRVYSPMLVIRSQLPIGWSRS